MSPSLTLPPSSSPARGSPVQLSIKCPQVLLLGQGTRDSFRWMHLLRELSLKALDAVLVLPVPTPFQPISFLRTPMLGVSGFGADLPSVLCPTLDYGACCLCGSVGARAQSYLWPSLPLSILLQFPTLSLKSRPVVFLGWPLGILLCLLSKNASSNVFLNFLNPPIPQISQFPEF